MICSEIAWAITTTVWLQGRHMVTTFMLSTVDQESGVHGILVPMYMLCWVVHPRGTTRATVSTSRLNYFSNPVALQGMPF